MDNWDICCEYNVGAQEVIFTLYSCIRDPAWSLMLIGTGYIQVMYLGRAPRTKETLPDFREKCRVTRYSRVFPRVDGLSTDPRDLGRHSLELELRYTAT